MTMWRRVLFYSISLIILLSANAQQYEDYFEIEETSPSDLNYNESDLNRHNAEVYSLKLDTSFKDNYRSEEYNYYTKKKEEKVEEELEAVEADSTPGEPLKGHQDENTARELEYETERNVGTFPKVILNVVLVIAVLFIAYVLFMILKDVKLKKKTLSRSTVSQSTVSESRAIIEEEEGGDLYKLLQKAIDDKKYDLAIRYYFLIYLAGLQDKQLIIYHKDKTNADYIQELNDDHLNVFLKLSYHFEYMWYGKKNLDDAEFEQVQHLYQNTLKNYGA